MAFTVTYNDEDFEIDNFCKVLMFQNIVDMDIDNNTKSLLLFILRKTLCFDKLSDRLSMHFLSKQLRISDKTLRNTVKNALNEKLIQVDYSRGGKTSSVSKYNSFALSDLLLIDLIDYVIEIREANDFKG